MKNILVGMMLIGFAFMIGCTGVDGERVLEPDGHHGYMITCRLGSPWRCVEEAETRCAEVSASFKPVISSNEQDNSKVYPGMIQRGQKWFLNVQCVK